MVNKIVNNKENSRVENVLKFLKNGEKFSLEKATKPQLIVLTTQLLREKKELVNQITTLRTEISVFAPFLRN